jgi:uncharacterized protein (TIGR03086 family)
LRSSSRAELALVRAGDGAYIVGYDAAMDHFEALDRAADGFARRLTAVTDGDLAKPTVCDGWSVADLLTHIMRGNTMAVVLCHGGSKDDALAAMESVTLASDRVAQFHSTAAAAAEALRAPGALEMTVHHPAMDMPGEQLLRFRIGDLLAHSWDLARAIGADEALDPSVVEVVWTQIEPMIPFIGAVGVFGTGPSGEVDETAGLQARLLDAMGRRP